MTALGDRLASGGMWATTLALNGFVALYGGAWLGQLLTGQPYGGAFLGLCNLLAAVIIRAKEKPSLSRRVHALVRDASPYSSVLVLLVVFSLAEAAAFFIFTTAARWLL